MNKQRGMTLIGWIIVLGVLAFFATVVIRVFPMYQEYYGVVQIMQGMEKELENNKLTKQQVWVLFAKRFNTGYIKNVKKENVEIHRGRNSPHITKVVVDYEVREPFIAQIDLIGHFHREIDVEPKRR